MEIKSETCISTTQLYKRELLSSIGNKSEKKQIQDLLPLSAILDESDAKPNLISCVWKKKWYLVTSLGTVMLETGVEVRLNYLLFL